MRILFYILLIQLSCFFSCSNKQSEKVFENSKVDKQIQFLKGKKINSKVLDDSIQNKIHVILLYNGFDCSSCIDIGYEIAKEIDFKNKSQLVHIVSTTANIGRDQLKNDYKKYVYNDENDEIRKSLKFINTPVFLLLDSNSVVINVFYPNYNRDKEKEKEFIKLVLNRSK